MKIEAGAEVYGFIIYDNGTITHISEKVAHIGTDDGALITFAEATLAATLAFFAITSF